MIISPAKIIKASLMVGLLSSVSLVSGCAGKCDLDGSGLGNVYACGGTSKGKKQVEATAQKVEDEKARTAELEKQLAAAQAEGAEVSSARQSIEAEYNAMTKDVAALRQKLLSSKNSNTVLAGKITQLEEMIAQNSSSTDSSSTVKEQAELAKLRKIQKNLTEQVESLMDE